MMVGAMHHDPAWNVATWIDEATGVYVGRVERRNSSSNGMTVFNERRDIALVISGEQFSCPEIRTGSGSSGQSADCSGHPWVSRFYDDDPEFPKKLNGRFHGVLTDRRRGVANIFIDRYGLHRLYYHEAKESFYFAAEAKAILAAKPELATIAPQALGEFVACGCVMENRTLFQGIRILPAAASWTFRGASLERRGTYFDPREWEEQAQGDPEQYYRDLREVFSQKLGDYLQGPEPVGMSLTGGLDTRMIMAWQKSVPGALPCYSFGGAFRDSGDVRVARAVARECGQSHKVLRVGSEFLKQFPHYAERAVYLTDGCVAVNHAPDLYLNKLAAEIAPVRMTGNYGGEVLRRVRAFKPVDPVEGLFRPELLSYVQAAKGTYANAIRVHPLSFAVFRQAPWHHYGLLALEQTQVSIRSPYLDNEFVKTVFRAPEAAVAGHAVSLRLIADGNPTLARIPTDLGIAGSHGLSIALKRRAHQFTFKAEYAYDSGMPQWLARIDHFFSSWHLERIFLGRHKFSHFRIWYRDALSRYVQQILLDPRSLSRPFVEPQKLESIVRGHIEGRQNNTVAIHKMLTLELVHRLFIDSSRQSEQVGSSTVSFCETRA